jgi:hypothetical protein
MAGSSLSSFLSDACKTKAVNICSGIVVVRVKAVVWWKTSRDNYHYIALKNFSVRAHCAPLLRTNGRDHQVRNFVFGKSVRLMVA